jgi:hypothetical protein
MTLNIIFQRESALTGDGVKKQLPLWNKVNLSFDGCTSMNKPAKTLVMEYSRDPNWALCED